MENKTIDHHVALSWTEKRYPTLTEMSNNSFVHLALQNLLEALGLPRDNPFAGKVFPGETALIKPNWVRDYNPLGHDLDSLVTHFSIIFALMDLLAKAMEGRGKIVIADAPLQNCDFDRLMTLTKMKAVAESFQKQFPNMEVILEDWRLTVMERRTLLSSWKSTGQQRSRDAFGQQTSDRHQVVDRGNESFLEDISDLSDRFRVTCYKWRLMQQHHRPGKHEYLITQRVFNVDFMINVSKMKTHIKAGLTGALKSLIGINGHKEYLPHHIKGPWMKGGDNYLLSDPLRERYEDLYDDYWEHFAEMSPLKKKMYAAILQILWKGSLLTSRERISAGSWRGNDTVWRTTLDLNHALYFGKQRRSRSILNIVDGIIAGEGEGPLSPTPRPLGLLIGGENPGYVDAVMGKIMGYNLSRVPTVHNAIYDRRSGFAGPFLKDYSVVSVQQNGKHESLAFDQLPNMHFVKPRYWRNADAGSL